MRFKTTPSFALNTLTLACSMCVSPAFAQAEPDPKTLGTVDVVGRRQGGQYHADEVSGSKTNLPLRELPQAVRVITRQALDDLGAVRLDDALDYVGGVSRQNNFGGLWDNIAIRGLPGNENTGTAMLQNGFSANRGFNAPRDTAHIERLEFLKGPAAALYGSSEPGGTINMVTKKPQWKSAHSAEAYGGSYGFARSTLDTTGPLSDNMAYRLNAAVEDRGSFRDHVRAHRSLLAPALTWKLGQGTLLDYNGELLQHQTPLDRGVVAINGVLGAVPRERFLGEPNDGNITINNQTHQLTLDHEWSADWRSRAGLSYRQGTLNGTSTEASRLSADNQTLLRQRRLRDFASDDTALQAEVQGQVRTGSVAHELLLGTETYRFNLSQRMLRINPSTVAPYSINVFNPVYGQTQPTPLANTDTQETQRNTAFYAQDAVQLNTQWRLLMGLRMDNFKQSLNNRRTGVTTAQSPTSTAPRIGLSYLPNAQWTWYANAGKSFRANTGTDAAGNAFAPESGQALELGSKWESLDGKLGATLAVFNITKKNALTADPTNTGFSMAAGQLRSRGVELDVAGQLSTRWRLTANLSVNDVKITQDNTLEVGGRLLNVPKLNGSLLAVYEDALGTQGGRFGLGGGLSHVGARLGEARTQAQANAQAAAFELPAYTTAKLVAYWRLSPTLRVSLDVDNLLDKRYYSSSYSQVWVTPGAARAITVGVQAKF